MFKPEGLTPFVNPLVEDRGYSGQNHRRKHDRERRGHNGPDAGHSVRDDLIHFGYIVIEVGHSYRLLAGIVPQYGDNASENEECKQCPDEGPKQGGQATEDVGKLAVNLRHIDVKTHPLNPPISGLQPPCPTRERSGQQP